MNLASGLTTLRELGLNVFASIPVRELPPELRAFAPGNEFDDFNFCLLGHGGGKLWTSLPHPKGPGEHPFDTFTLKHVEWFIREVLADKDAVLAFPRPDWLLPLQKLGRFMNLARPSLLGLDLHYEFGPWFAYRAAWLTKAEIPRITGPEFSSACASCVAKPCRIACPPRAIGESAETFRLKTCSAFRFEQHSVCADRCLARMACPVKSEHRYSLAQIQYHMVCSRS